MAVETLDSEYQTSVWEDLNAQNFNSYLHPKDRSLGFQAQVVGIRASAL